LGALVGLICFSGCEDLWDAASEAAFGRDLEIVTPKAPAGQVGVAYEWRIQTRIQNEPNDDSYDYDWELREGELPDGLVFSDEGDEAMVAGVPEESGESIVFVYVDSDEFTVALGSVGENKRGRMRIWLVYGDFLGARPTENWSQEPEFAGGILAHFDATWSFKPDGTPTLAVI